MPCSQPRGAFHGRAERFSGSVLLQPVTTAASTSKRSANARFMLLHVEDLIAFHHVTKLPARHNVGNTAVGLNA